jgi:putative addiction module killer protein
VLTLISSSTFDAWFRDLKDRRAKEKILARLTRLEQGNFGDTEPVGEGVSEMRINFGPGYRVYIIRSGPAVSSSPAVTRRPRTATSNSRKRWRAS